MKILALTLVALTTLTSDISAAVFQYSVPVKTEKADSTAFLWLPPEAKQIRGIVVAGMTLMESEFVKDERIRKACSDEQIAIVFLKCGLLAGDVQKVLDDLAQASGYRELSMAPLFFVGHSAGGPQAKAMATKMADRCFGIMQYRGGLPGGNDPVPPGIPALAMLGEFDEFGGMMRDASGMEHWEKALEGIAAYRTADAHNLASIVVEPGAGHFPWSIRNADYLALFIRKAAHVRIPEWSMDARAPVPCKKIDPDTGWLTPLNLKTPGTAAASYADYPDDKTKAAWHLDKELADATLAYHAHAFGKKDQFIKWTDEYWVDAGVRYFFSKVKWVGDGQTFEVHPVYSDTYPKPEPNGPRWAATGEQAGHSNSPILVKKASGPIVIAGPNTFRIGFDNLSPATDPFRATFLAYSLGDAEYRYTETVGMLPRNFPGLKDGKPQSITFPAIGNLKANGAPMDLKATSDAGLKIEYYVASGPAEIVDGKIKIAELPARATFPVAIRVVAYQFGRGVDPQVQTAAPVEQTIQLEKP